MSKNKKQHYVSSFYLYNFTSEQQKENSGSRTRKTLIWHFDKNKGEVKERPIDKIATESYLFSFQKSDGVYDHSLDDELKEVEGRAGRSFRRLSEIVNSLKTRPESRVSIPEEIISDVIEFMVWQVRRHPDLVADVLRRCKEASEGKEWSMLPKEMALDVISGFGRDDYSSFAEVLASKNIAIIITTNDKAAFITTDVPFVRFNKSMPDGIGHESTEIYFPLASNMLLFLQGSGGQNTIRVENDRKFLRGLNIYLARHSKNYIFGNSKEHIESIVGRI